MNSWRWVRGQDSGVCAGKVEAAAVQVDVQQEQLEMAGWCQGCTLVHAIVELGLRMGLCMSNW